MTLPKNRAVSFFIAMMTFMSVYPSASADSPTALQASIAEDCQGSSDGCDVPSCQKDYQQLGQPMPFVQCQDGTSGGTPSTSASGGPSGIPMGGGFAGTTPAVNAAAAQPAAPALPVFVSCPLNIQDSFATEMQQVMTQIKIGCPNIGNSTDMIDKYMANYINQNGGLPDGITCSNYNTVLAAQLKEAEELPSVLNMPPNNAYAQCWVYTYDENSNISTYVLTQGCIQSTTGPIRQQITDTCGSIRNANFKSDSIDDALSSITKEVSDSKAPGCRDVVPAVTGLVGALIGTTPVGVFGVSAMQIFSGFIDKMMNRAKSKEQDELKKVLKANTDQLRQSSNACNYYKFSQALLNCSRFSPPQSPNIVPLCADDPTNMAAARDSINTLNSLLVGVSDKVTASTVNVDDPKITEAAKLAITATFYTQLNKILATNVTYPDGSGKSGPLRGYLDSLTNSPALPNGQEEDLDVSVARSRLKALLQNIDESTQDYKKGYTKDLKNGLLKALLEVGDDPTKAPFSLDILTAGASGLKAIAAFDLKTDTQAKVSAAVAAYRQSLESAAVKTADAERDLNQFIEIKQNKDDLSAFVKTRVDEYKYLKGAHNGAGPDNPRVLQIAEDKAVQACADLAPSIYYTGTNKPGVPYEETVNPNFQADYKDACGALFGVAPALKHLADKPPAGMTPGNFFDKNVCSTGGIKVLGQSDDKPKATQAK